jgi:light-independent protochlorophyllide reductase subunit B
MMGLEEHLLAMFRDDFEFNDAAAPSHLGSGTIPAAEPEIAPMPVAQMPSPPVEQGDVAVLEAPLVWAEDAEKELRKIPFFVRGKARRNTERFAQGRGVTQITVETLYDAKSHFSR